MGMAGFPIIAVALLFLLHTTSIAAFSANEELLRNFSHNGTVWPVTVAAFGNRLDSKYDSTFYLVRPPKDDINGTLCSVPSLIMNASLENIDLPEYTYSIGLFVAWGECSPETKARNLLSIQSQIPRVTHLVVYGSDPTVGTEQIIMFPDSVDNVNELVNMVAIYMPTDYASEIIDRMWEQANEDLISPFFLEPHNDKFWFRVTIKQNYLPDNDNGNTRGRPPEDDYDESYLWFRFVLFSLLIVAPCARAVFLWYQGGGRFIWRRNEDGRIIGLQYIPPMPYWLAAGRFIHANQELAAFTLTEEQFDSLPEIKFEPVNTAVPSDMSIDRDQEVAPDHSAEKTGTIGSTIVTIVETPTLVAEDEESRVSWEDKDREVGAAGESDQTIVVAVNAISIHRENGEPSSVAKTAPNVEATPDANEANPNSTTCTTCSICIDDFEQGEALVLLPRCRHAFHKDCIKPWLRERQGCCPLCKTDVLPPSDQTTDDSTPSLDGEPPGTVSAPDDTPHRSI